MPDDPAKRPRLILIWQVRPRRLRHSNRNDALLNSYSLAAISKKESNWFGRCWLRSALICRKDLSGQCSHCSLEESRFAFVVSILPNEKPARFLSPNCFALISVGLLPPGWELSI